MRQTIGVDDRGHVREPVSGCDKSRFPDLSFLKLAITEDHPGVEILVAHPSPEGHTDTG